MEPLYSSFGGLSLPVSNAAPGNLGLGLDPARTVLLDLFAAAINAELGARWAKVVAVFGSGHALSGTSPVQFKLELPPNPSDFGQLKVKWPLLSLHRDGTGEYSEPFLHHDKLVQPWQLNYILGPTSIEDIRRVGDACVAAAKIVRQVIRQRGHVAYEDGALQFGTGKGNLSSVELRSHVGPGQATFVGSEDNVFYQAITLNLETVELVNDDPEAYGALEGASFDFGIGGGEGTINGLLYADTDAP